MIGQTTQTLALTTFHRARMLEMNGRVLVRVGQKVAAGDVVAEAPARNRHELIDLYQALNLGRKAELKQILQRRPGDVLQEGDVIASTGGLFKKILRAPAPCRFLSVMAGGRILLELESDTIQLKAGLSGVISEVIPERGVVIESSGALIQGVWGNGKMDSGTLRCLGKSPQDEFTRQVLDVTLRGSIGFCGICTQLDALQAAAELPLRGLILGSMPSSLQMAAARLPIPIILLEGFGRVPVNRLAYQILSTSEQRDVSVNAVEWDRMRGTRSEVLVSLPASGSEYDEIEVMKPGQTVRIHLGRHWGKVGSIESLPLEPVTFPGGVRARCAMVKLPNNQVVPVPFENLDILQGTNT